jgi:putative acetyltransferase
MFPTFPTIRPERPQDVEGIRTVHAAAFPTDVESRLVDALREAGQLCISLIAEVSDQIVGHIVLSPVTVDGRHREGLGLAPVAVLPSHQRRGIGSALIVEGLHIARELGYGFVVVLGHPEYYPRFGFRRASELGLGNEYGAEEAFMVVELVPRSLPAGGLVRYVAEFGRFT